jgi:hypothetical protein
MGILGVFTSMVNQHEEVLKYVLKCLTEEHLYISPKKLQPYAIRFNCLGHSRDEDGLHASADKLELIRKWPTPSNYHDVHTKPETVWVVCDACLSGCGAYLGQGNDWKTMCPAGFMSKKFTDMQRSYFTYEHETLGVIEALKKWDWTPRN